MYYVKLFIILIALPSLLIYILLDELLEPSPYTLIGVREWLKDS